MIAKLPLHINSHEPTLWYPKCIVINQLIRNEGLKRNADNQETLLQTPVLSTIYIDITISS